MLTKEKLAKSASDAADWIASNIMTIAIGASVIYTGVLSVNSVRSTNAEVKSKKAYARQINDKLNSHK